MQWPLQAAIAIINYSLYPSGYKLQLIMDDCMWTVLLGKVFEQWLHEQEEGLQERVLAELLTLQNYGPHLTRPWADTVKGSRYNNMKELRINYLAVLFVRSLLSIPSARRSCLVRVTRVTTKKYFISG